MSGAVIDCDLTSRALYLGGVLARAHEITVLIAEPELHAGVMRCHTGWFGISRHEVAEAIRAAALKINTDRLHELIREAEMVYPGGSVRIARAAWAGGWNLADHRPAEGPWPGDRTPATGEASS